MARREMISFGPSTGIGEGEVFGIEGSRFFAMQVTGGTATATLEGSVSGTTSTADWFDLIASSTFVIGQTKFSTGDKVANHVRANVTVGSGSTEDVFVWITAD
ncbi:MAG: hypothetical protein QNL12_03270 [Acidimicrobiia bacterium]|nr:hypothetical protein [Acidimicrobiia bacterium]